MDKLTPLEPIRVPSGTFIHSPSTSSIDRHLAESSTEAVEVSVNEGSSESPYLQAQAVQVESEEYVSAMRNSNVPLAMPSAPSFDDKSNIHEIARNTPFVDNEVYEADDEQNDSSSDAKSFNEPVERITHVPPFVENEMYQDDHLQEDGAGSISSPLVTRKEPKDGGVSATTMAAAKFAAGRERAILREIEEDRAEENKRKHELGAAFVAATAIGKLAVARETAIMERITREQLEEEEQDFESERQEILRRAEEELAALALEHRRAKKEIKGLAIDVLTEEERERVTSVDQGESDEEEHRTKETTL